MEILVVIFWVVTQFSDMRHSNLHSAALHVTWVPVTTAWRILRLRMEETASRYGGWRCRGNVFYVLN